MPGVLMLHKDYFACLMELQATVAVLAGDGTLVKPLGAQDIVNASPPDDLANLVRPDLHMMLAFLSRLAHLLRSLLTIKVVPVLL